MAVVRIADIVVPTVFTTYTTQNSMESSALVASGVLARNAAIEEQLTAGAEFFTVPSWLDLGDAEADLVDDDPAHLSVPHNVGTSKQITRKSFLHSSWSAMNLASELAGSDASGHISSRVTSYWTRQMERRVISSINGILANNIASDGGDMVLDISAGTGDAAIFSAGAVIDASWSLGDKLGGLTGIAMHSDTYRRALKDDLIVSIPDSQGRPFSTFRGMATIVDDLMPLVGGVYTTAMLGAGAIAWGMTEPRIAPGTEVENQPSSGNGGGMQILHSRVNTAVQPAGHSWVETTVVGESPSLAELALPANWDRSAPRKATPIAFLKHRNAAA